MKWRANWVFRNYFFGNRLGWLQAPKGECAQGEIFPHQENNALPDQLCEAVVVRSGQEPNRGKSRHPKSRGAGLGNGSTAFHPEPDGTDHLK